MNDTPQIGDQLNYKIIRRSPNHPDEPRVVTIVRGLERALNRCRELDSQLSPKEQSEGWKHDYRRTVMKLSTDLETATRGIRQRRFRKR